MYAIRHELDGRFRNQKGDFATTVAVNALCIYFVTSS